MSTLIINRLIDCPVLVVGTSPTRLLTEAQGQTRGVRWVGFQGEGTVYLCGPSGTTSTGIKYGADQIEWIEHEKGSELYLVAAANTNVRVLLGTVT